MQFKVNRGYVKHEGVLHKKGSFFDASPDDMKELLLNGTVAACSPTMGTDQYDSFAADNDTFNGASDPEADGQDDLVPAFHADDVIVDAEIGPASKRGRK